MDVRGVSPDAMREIGLGVKTMVGKVEARLCAVNEAGESWPMEFGLWAPDGEGPTTDGNDSLRYGGIMVRRKDASVLRSVQWH